MCFVQNTWVIEADSTAHTFSNKSWRHLNQLTTAFIASRTTQYILEWNRAYKSPRHSRNRHSLFWNRRAYVTEMLKYILLTFALVNVCCSQRRHKEDPFAALDQHLFHSLAYNYLWPWSAMFKAAAALDASESVREPQIISNAEKYEVIMNVKRFLPDELKVRVKNHFVTVRGRHKEKGDDIKIIASHFVQRFELSLNENIVMKP